MDSPGHGDGDPPDAPQEVRPRRSNPERERARRRRRARLAALVVLLLAGAATGLWAASRGSSGLGASAHLPGGSPPGARAERFAVGLRIIRFTDTTRTVAPSGGAPQPRPLVTFVRYPVVGRPSGRDLAGAPPALSSGPFPLVVFGHGFALTPNFYAALLRSWVEAGYVVAAPEFPLENAAAPGGPDENDLVNQPADVRFVISRMVVVNASPGPLAGLVDPSRIAVAGHSDGGDTALAVSYGRLARDRRVRATIVLAGAKLPGTGGFSSRGGSPPLFAVQGTADGVNLSNLTDVFYRALARPKFRLRLLGAGHFGPYSSQQPQLGIIEGTTTAFLDLYLKRQPAALRRLVSRGSVRALATLAADP